MKILSTKGIKKQQKATEKTCPPQSGLLSTTRATGIFWRRSGLHVDPMQAVDPFGGVGLTVEPPRVYTGKCGSESRLLQQFSVAQLIRSL